MKLEANKNFIDSYFKISDRKSTIAKEIVAGLIIFISMCYIIFVQESILYDGINIYNLNHPDSSFIIPKGTIGIITAITAAFASILMGMYANYPVALASGMGANAFIAYTLIAEGMSPGAAMVAIFISGLLFVLVAMTGLRKKILNAIPNDIKTAISIGVGLFIMYVGLINSGIIESGSGTPTKLGLFSDPSVILALFAIASTMILWIWEIKGAIIISIFLTIILGIFFNILGLNKITNANPLPDFNWTKIDYASEFKGIGVLAGQSFISMSDVKNVWANPEFYIAVLTLFMTDFFDTAGTLFAINKTMENEGVVANTDKALVVDAISTVVCSTIGATNVTSFAESNAGVTYGGKTGLTSVTTGLLFIIVIPILPLIGGLVTSSVTTGAMVLVGMSMASQFTKLNFKDKVILSSSILIIMITILSYSIGTGIVLGLLFYVLFMIFTGRWSEVDIWLYCLTPILILFVMLPLI